MAHTRPDTPEVGVPIPTEDDEYPLDPPDTESEPRSPVTGQTADDSQDSPGQ